jgi:hypothetical protein
MGTEANISVSRPLVYTAPLSTALPTITGTLGSTITMTGFTDIGFLAEKVEIEFTKEDRDIQPMNEVAPIDAKTIRKGVMVKVTCMESDADLLAIALQSASETSDVISDNAAGDTTFLSMAVVTALKVYHLKKVKSDENVTIPSDDTEEDKVEITFKGYLDTGETAGEQLWKIHERTAA